MGERKRINGVKVFSATMRPDREVLGDKVTTWMESAKASGLEIVEMTVTQSSDEKFHCIAITIFYFDPVAAARTIPPATRRVA